MPFVRTGWHDGAPSLRAGLQRLFDIVLASCALVAAAPVMALAALAIMAESGRPVFFSQVRLGEGGKPFRIHKFRKFRNDPACGNRPLTLRKDDRLTRVGRLIERTKIDELPQLWDILRGKMSLVGPRPETTAFADCFAGRRSRVLDFRPGLFGPSQTAFRNEGALYPGWCEPEIFYRRTLFPAKAELDLAYYPRRTLLGDAGWILSGVGAVVGLSGRRHGPPALGLSRRQTGPAPGDAPDARHADSPADRVGIAQAAE